MHPSGLTFLRGQYVEAGHEPYGRKIPLFGRLRRPGPTWAGVLGVPFLAEGTLDAVNIVPAILVLCRIQFLWIIVCPSRLSSHVRRRTSNVSETLIDRSYGHSNWYYTVNTWPSLLCDSC